MDNFETGTALDEAGFSGGGAGWENPDQASRKRRREWHEKWRKAEAIRANWTPEMIEQEEQRLADEIANWGRRDAA